LRGYTLPTTASISPSTTDDTAGLLERFEELSRQVASLRASQTHSRPHSRVRYRLHSRNRRSSTTDNSAAPRHLLVPLAVRGRSPKMVPTVLPPAEGLPPAERLPTADRHRQQENSTGDVNGSQRLHHQLRPPLRYGSQLETAIPNAHRFRPCVPHVGSCRGAGSPQTTPYTPQVGPPFPPMDGPQGA